MMAVFNLLLAVFCVLAVGGDIFGYSLVASAPVEKSEVHMNVLRTNEKEPKLKYEEEKKNADRIGHILRAIKRTHEISKSLKTRELQHQSNNLLERNPENSVGKETTVKRHYDKNIGMKRSLGSIQDLFRKSAQIGHRFQSENARKAFEVGSAAKARGKYGARKATHKKNKKAKVVSSVNGKIKRQIIPGAFVGPSQGQSQDPDFWESSSETTTWNPGSYGGESRFQHGPFETCEWREDTGSYFCTNDYYSGSYDSCFLYGLGPYYCDEEVLAFRGEDFDFFTNI